MASSAEARASELTANGFCARWIASASSGFANRHPIRNAARPNAFENVRVTTRFGNLRTQGKTVSPQNSKYASSTRTTVPAAAKCGSTSTRTRWVAPLKSSRILPPRPSSGGRYFFRRATALRGRTIGLEPRFNRMGVRPQTFGAGQRDDGVPETGKAPAAELLHGNRLDEIGGAQTASQARAPARRENVVGPGSIIARSDGARAAEED